MKTKQDIIIEKDVTLYKDFNFKDKFKGTYNIEFRGEKARVHQDWIFGVDRSRFAKVHRVGKATEYFYKLRANKQTVFFKSKHNIYAT